MNKDLLNALAILAIIGYFYQSGFRVSKPAAATPNTPEAPQDLESLANEVRNLRQTVDLVNEIKSLRTSVEGTLGSDPVAEAEGLIDLEVENEDKRRLVKLQEEESELELVEEAPEQLALDMAMEEEDAIVDLMEENNFAPENRELMPENERKLVANANGDPHFHTWKGEHFEYHGQCDMVLASNPKFADGLGLDVHIRTKTVRYWSYIKNAAIKIGNDVLEIEGSPDPEDRGMHYWYNFEYHGELDGMGGFPVTATTNDVHKRFYEIDLDSKYPGQKILISTYKEFIRVDFKETNEEAYGGSVGILGDYTTGKTLARDGSTVIDDFIALGEEWQVHPHEPMLFHRNEEPVFPQKCIEPEDPRGDRRRRLDESSVTEEQAEKACSQIKDPLSRKDCVYDILATQDIGMVGAY